jgi:hypothetical protein
VKSSRGYSNRKTLKDNWNRFFGDTVHHYPRRHEPEASPDIIDVLLQASNHLLYHYNQLQQYRVMATETQTDAEFLDEPYNPLYNPFYSKPVFVNQYALYAMNKLIID